MRRAKSLAVYTFITTAAEPGWSPAWCSAVSPGDRRRSADGDARRVAQRLQDDAVALGGLDHALQLGRIGITVDLEPQRNITQANRNATINAECAARIPRAFGDHPTTANGDAGCGSYCAHRDASAGDQRLQQHVCRASLLAGAAG